MPVFTALARSFRDLAQPRILAVLFLPMLGAIIVWSVLGWFFWDSWSAAFTAFTQSTTIGRWLVLHGASWFLGSLTFVFGLALLVPAMFITAVIITELVAMPVIVSLVARRYPALEKARGGSAAGSILNATTAIVVFALLWLVTLPLWLTGIGAIVLPALNSAYLNQRLFRYDALAEHATPAEYREIGARCGGSLYLLGLSLALLYYVPFLNVVVPVLSGLAFTHYCLRELAIVRGQRPL